MNRENSIEKETIKAEDITDITLIQAGYYWKIGFNEFDFTCKIKGVDDVSAGQRGEADRPLCKCYHNMCPIYWTMREHGPKS